MADTHLDKLIDASAEIYGSEPESRAYLHVVLAQCGLPYRQPPPELRDYIRQNGKTTLVLTSGHLLHPKTRQPVLQGIPYGAKPRLLLIHLCTEAKLRKSPEIDVGHSMSAFMQDLGLSVTGGATGSIGRFKDQLNRLAASRMQLLFEDDDKVSMVNAASPISQFDVWFPKKPDQKILWPNTITLSQEFYSSLMDQNALPLDPRAIKGLQRSAMALDVYVWLAHRLCRIPHAQPVTISWFAVRRQFGPEYEDMYKFRQDFKEALAKVMAVYRDAKVSFDSNGILQLRQSRPSVAKAPLRGN
jgi:replication initiator protein